MKKFYFVLAAIATTLAIGATACSENVQDDYSENVSVVEFDDAVTRSECDAEVEAFAELNQELMQLSEIYPSEVIARSNRPFWNGLKKIVAADAIGACCAIGPSVIWSLNIVHLGAIYSSLRELAEILDPDNPVLDYLPRVPELNPNINTNTASGVAEYAGYIHNLVLYDVYSELGENIRIVPSEYIKETIVRKYSRYGRSTVEENSYFVRDTISPSRCSAIMADFDQLTPQQFIARMATVIPNRANEINIFGTFCCQYNDYVNQTTKDSYTTAFMRTVRNSSISIDSKNYIISAVSVANYSDKLWEPVEN